MEALRISAANTKCPTRKWGQGKWGQCANLDKIPLSATLPACQGFSVWSFPVPFTIRLRLKLRTDRPAFAQGFGRPGVMARGNRRETIFHDDDDRRFFLATLSEACGMTGWRVHAWVLMGNHPASA